MSEERSIEALMSRIDARIAEMERSENELSAEEQEILMLVKGMLTEHGLKYSYDPDLPKVVTLSIAADNKPYRMIIALQNGKIILRAALPFRVQCNSLALVCLYISEFNKNKAFTHLNLDFEDGEISMEYSLLCAEKGEYDDEKLWVYLMSMICAMSEVYMPLQRLAVGKVPEKNGAYYKKLIEMSLDVLEGREGDEEDILLGTKGLGQKTMEGHEALDFSDQSGRDVFAEWLKSPEGRELLGEEEVPETELMPFEEAVGEDEDGKNGADGEDEEDGEDDEE